MIYTMARRSVAMVYLPCWCRLGEGKTFSIVTYLTSTCNKDFHGRFLLYSHTLANAFVADPPCHSSNTFSAPVCLLCLFTIMLVLSDVDDMVQMTLGNV
ncbi:hypothetical protein BS17DRAFT_317197 [Gyrodon lividus]|nr:hypothetical protein BS17DRAFT_317197 [Gyrodon lividus]